MTETGPRVAATSPGTPPAAPDGLPAAVPRLPLLVATNGILVTGSHRSGTTWVGRMLAAAPGVDYLHEPFKPGPQPPTSAVRSDTWFPHIADHNAARWEEPTRRTLRFGFSWRAADDQAPGLRQAVRATN